MAPIVGTVFLFFIFVGCAFNMNDNLLENIHNEEIYSDSNETSLFKEPIVKSEHLNLTNETFTEIDSENITSDVTGRIQRKPNDTDFINNSTEKSDIDSPTASNETLRSNNTVVKEKNSSTLKKSSNFYKKYNKMVELMHIESIKTRLLAKLGLDKPPKLKGPRPAIPEEVLDRAFIKDEGRRRNGRTHQNFYAQSVQVFVMGTDVTSECSNKKGAACYYFDLKNKVSVNDVYKVELWAYKLYNHNDPYIQKFVVSELSKEFIKRRPKKMVARMEFRKKQGWVKVELKRTVLHWLRRPQKNHGIAIVCSTCYRKNRKWIFSAKADTRPFLIITKRKGYNSRPKRSVPRVCTETSTDCCLKTLTIDLNDHGWNGMVYPHNIEANYCIGSCHDQDNAHYNHTQLIQDYRWNLNDVSMLRRLTPCCAPISYSSVALMYMNNNDLEVVRVPNIIATACGCV